MKTLLAYILLLVALPTTIALALDPPQGTVLLTINGKITTTNTEGAAQFDVAMLQALPQKTIKAETPWTAGVTKFSGPLLRDVLQMVGANGDSLLMTAINEYQVKVPVTDANFFNCILAMSVDGEILTIRTKGPLWLIYPWDTFDALRTETYYSRSIWQLKAIEIQ
ncbi:molybdopterin-dependent oxidoreductase [Desulfopila aestuarii]|uniref:Oxidoreductase molybdopterin-binding domain-containing protein n=1 Tax=Desulfopila aestuarii DSM 18488 TaxID=1121416 RepID=A0A1M7XWQ3_9BACT|nr:molybdopterin-dependent oxidoreductase [Desulfopila aestuarii]SHO43187.1 hypothetical protein SAMN02745220_00327 [Desulfopila aestuarii DSM 18488]